MLMHTAIQRTSTAQQPARPAAPAVGSKAFRSSIELMGAPMPFGRNAEIYGENEPAYSENCLVLNVWTPEWPSRSANSSTGTGNTRS